MREREGKNAQLGASPIQDSSAFSTRDVLALQTRWVLANAELTSNPLTHGRRLLQIHADRLMKVIMLMEILPWSIEGGKPPPDPHCPCCIRCSHATTSAPLRHFRGSPYGAAKCQTVMKAGRPQQPAQSRGCICLLTAYATGPTLRTGPSFCAMQGSSMACCAPAHPNCTCITQDWSTTFWQSSA